MKQIIFSRRTLLRGTLLTGSGLALSIAVGSDQPIPAKPMSFRSPSGHGNQQPTQVKSLSPAYAMKEPADDEQAIAGSPPEAAKVSQVNAKYQDRPNGNEKCANCKWLEADNTSCQLVSGSVKPDGWCTLYVSVEQR